MGHVITKEQQAAYIAGFKRLIDRYREIASQAYVGVNEHSLKDLYDECKVPRMWNPFVQDYLIDNQLLSVKGERRMMSYKWVERNPEDSYALAKRMYEECSVAASTHRKELKKQYTIKNAEKHDLKSYSSEAVKLESKPKEYELGDKVFFLASNAISEGEIVTKSYDLERKSEEDGLSLSTINRKKIIYTMFVDKIFPFVRSDEVTIFPSVDLLLESLRLKFDKKK